MSEVKESRPEAPAAAEQAKPKRAVVLDPQRMQQREILRQDWAVNAEAGTTVEDVLDPQYWAHMAAQLEPYARIEVLVETGEWMLDLLVINHGRNWAQVHMLHRYDLEERAESMPAATKHRVEWKGPQRKWTILRLSDGALIQEGHASKFAAQEALERYERTTG